VGQRWRHRGLLVTAVGDNNMREGIDFLPLTVDYQEFQYATGRIPGNFFRREMGRPSEQETLTSRLIDRPVRPRMPKGWTYETQIIATVYSADKIVTRRAGHDRSLGRPLHQRRAL
jgi:polyribonucleotide nucleotidyltransferase